MSYGPNGPSHMEKNFNYIPHEKSNDTPNLLRGEYSSRFRNNTSKEIYQKIKIRIHANIFMIYTFYKL